MKDAGYPRAVDPETTSRGEAFALWMGAPNPMVTFFKTLDVTRLIRERRRRGYPFNMLLCWCVGRAAAGIPEFYLLPVGRELVQYDTIAVSTIVKNRAGRISSCDVPFYQFHDILPGSSINRVYDESVPRYEAIVSRLEELTRQAAERCQNHDLTDSMVIGTSAIVDTELDGAVGMNSGIFNNPFLIWGKYRKGLFRTTLKVSFQFHHTQMDGAHAGRFLQRLQEAIDCV